MLKFVKNGKVVMTESDTGEIKITEEASVLKEEDLEKKVFPPAGDSSTEKEKENE